MRANPCSTSSTTAACDSACSPISGTAARTSCARSRDSTRSCSYTVSLKRRIAGPWGHLGNAEAARILATIDRSRLRTVVAAHLSRHNNRPDLARAALATVFDDDPSRLQVADQERGIGWITV